MRKHYLDNIRWITVMIVVVYHVIYMYNAEGILGGLGKITNLKVQYYDVFQYIVYPSFMILLFMISGISSFLYLEHHSEKEFLSSRTTKLLVPSTIGLFAFQFIQGYINASISGALDHIADLPFPVKALICVLSGVGVLWYIQTLWLFSVLLLPIRRIEKGRLREACRRIRLPGLLLLAVPEYLSAQILNMPVIVCYRFGIYLFAFLTGYFILSHEEVIAELKRWFPLFLILTVVTGTAFCLRYFGQNYADAPVCRTPLYTSFGYFTCLAVLGGMAEYGNFRTPFTEWMRSRSFGLYVFHYLGISAVALYLAKPKLLPAPAIYLLSLIAGFGGGFLLNAVICRIPYYRWAVLGIPEKKEPSAAHMH